MAQFRNVVLITEVITVDERHCHPQCWGLRMSFDTASCLTFARTTGGCTLLEQDFKQWFRCPACLRAENQFTRGGTYAEDDKEDEATPEEG